MHRGNRTSAGSKPTAWCCGHSGGNLGDMQRLIVVLIRVLQEIVGFANGVDNSVFVFRFYKRPHSRPASAHAFFARSSSNLSAE